MKLHSKQKTDKYLGGLLVAISLVAARFLGFMLRRDHALGKKPVHILFIKMMGIGSVWMAADAIAAVKEKYPDARLILMATPGVITGAKPLALFDEYYAFNDRSFVSIAGSSIKTIWRCWRKKKLWVANMEVYSKLASVFALWTGAINRFDFYFNEVAFRRHINTHPVYFNMHALVTENYNRMAAAMGAMVQHTFSLPGRLPGKRNPAPDKNKYILVNNTCSELARERMLPFMQWMDLLESLCREFPSCFILLAGSQAELTYNRQVESILHQHGYESRVRNITGEVSFEDYLGILYNETRLVITIDSGPLHFANRLGIPVVSLWGPTDPATRIIQEPLNKAVYLGVSCSPCTHHTEVLPCGGDNFCMKNITTAQILTAVKETIAGVS